MNTLPSVLGPYSHFRISNGLLFSSGQIGIDPKTNTLKASLEEQVHQTIANIRTLLLSNKLNFEHIIKVSIFVVDMNDFNTINNIYISYFTEPYPARETVQVSALPKHAKIEISIIAEIT